jgi:hypothetical protein
MVDLPLPMGATPCEKYVVYCENHDPRVKWASKCDPTDE